MVDPGYTLQRPPGHAPAFESGLLTAKSRLKWHSRDGILLGCKVCRASKRDVTKTRNGERGAGSGERRTGNGSLGASSQR